MSPVARRPPGKPIGVRRLYGGGGDDGGAPALHTPRRVRIDRATAMPPNRGNRRPVPYSTAVVVVTVTVVATAARGERSLLAAAAD